ncbi:Thermolysin metallopeptidase, catalytic domain [Paramicrobacterium humi]|uniref:Neutral metalloproteinase n=1 Tax=Paramicrobacterium humi TaxID=640635 RepID=A0A1H4PN10_9MICO|nr:Thermolysin metallopeptidase, catalytic domain [Microbacterium humi]
MDRERTRAVVPPYLLDRIASAERFRSASAAARRTLLTQSPGRSAVIAATGTPREQPRSAAASRSLRREVYDAKHAQSLPGALVRAEGAPAADDVAVNEAYDGLGKTYALYRDVYGRDSIDGAGMPLLASVHYGTDYDNAFWDGTRMVFGDGDGEVFRRFTISVSVIGHELTHGVTERTAALRYQGQSGALNESVSDVFGCLVEQYALGQSVDQATWLVGAGLFTDEVQGIALRSMKAPGTAYDDDVLGKDPQPATMAGYVDTTDDEGGVHINSGIPNRAFYLTAEALGGHAWDRAGAVWYATLTGGRLAADATFEDFASLTVTTAEEGFDATVASAVRDAWQTVGVLGASASTGTSHTPPAAPAGARKPETVSVERSGGVTGIPRAWRVDVAAQPDPDAWIDLLERLPWADAAHAGEPQGADRFRYRIRCSPPPRAIDDADAQIEVVLTETELTASWQELIMWVRTADGDDTA